MRKFWDRSLLLFWEFFYNTWDRIKASIRTGWQKWLQKQPPSVSSKNNVVQIQMVMERVIIEVNDPFAEYVFMG